MDDSGVLRELLDVAFIEWHISGEAFRVAAPMHRLRYFAIGRAGQNLLDEANQHYAKQGIQLQCSACRMICFEIHVVDGAACHNKRREKDHGHDSNLDLLLSLVPPKGTTFPRLYSNEHLKSCEKAQCSSALPITPPWPLEALGAFYKVCYRSPPWTGVNLWLLRFIRDSCPGLKACGGRRSVRSMSAPRCIKREVLVACAPRWKLYSKIVELTSDWQAYTCM
jgi:hypothetical protein